MKVSIYYTDGRVKYLDLVHEILERSDDIAVTYTNAIEMVYKTEIISKTEFSKLGVRL